MSGRKIIEGLSIDKHEFKLLISKMSHIKNKSSFCFYKTGFFSRFHTFFGCETKTGVVRILVVFFFPRYACVQSYHSKGLDESFPLVWLNIDLCRSVDVEILPKSALPPS